MKYQRYDGFRKLEFEVKNQQTDTKHSPTNLGLSFGVVNCLSFPSFHSELSTSVSKRVPVQNLSYGHDFDLQENDRARKTHFKEWLCTMIRFENRGQSNSKPKLCVCSFTNGKQHKARELEIMHRGHYFCYFISSSSKT